jgi:hypothetical protein
VKILLWLSRLFGVSPAGPPATSQNSSSPSKESSTPAPSTPPKPSAAKAAAWQADPRSERNLATVQPQLADLGRELLRRLAAQGLTFKARDQRTVLATQAERRHAGVYVAGRTKRDLNSWSHRTALKSRHIARVGLSTLDCIRWEKYLFAESSNDTTSRLADVTDQRAQPCVRAMIWRRASWRGSRATCRSCSDFSTRRRDVSKASTFSIRNPTLRLPRCMQTEAGLVTEPPAKGIPS